MGEESPLPGLPTRDKILEVLRGLLARPPQTARKCPPFRIAMDAGNFATHSVFLQDEAASSHLAAVGIPPELLSVT